MSGLWSSGNVGPQKAAALCLFGHEVKKSSSPANFAAKVKEAKPPENIDEPENKPVN